MGCTIRHILVILLTISFATPFLISQQDAKPKKILPKAQQSDTINLQQDQDLFRKDDNVLTPQEKFDTATTKTEISRKNLIDEIIKFKASDSVRFNVEKKHLFLRGKANAEYKLQRLESEIIEFYLDNSILKAEGIRTAEGKLVGFPAFTDDKETFYGERILYNFRTKQGTITLGETKLGEGFYFGDKIKRVSETDFFVHQGCYTTCNAPKPHYYFGSPRMKVVAGESVYLDPLIFYVEDIPLFIVPLGLYFPTRSGRQSGLITPSFFFSQRRGVTIENVGFYLALSDYYDTRFSLDFYSKGGFLLKNFTQWKYRNELSGSLEASFGRVRFNFDQPYQRTWGISLQHSHKINPFESYTADLRFYSQDYFRNTSIDLISRQTQDLTSNASYSRTFENGSSLSLSYSRSQNILTTEYTETPAFSFQIPQINPLKFIDPTNEFLRNLSLNYSLRANYLKNKRIIDTTFVYSHSSKIMHSPSISFQLPKINYFTFTPFINFSFNNYFRRLTKSINPSDSSIVETLEKGLFTEYSYSLGISASTKLYGIVAPNMFGVKFLRHTVSPTLQYSFTPDLSDPKYKFYGFYKDLRTNREVIYSRFEKDGGGIASRSRSQLISYNVQNIISMKYNPKDTGEDKTIDILSFNVSGNYNFVADSLNFSDINVSLYTTTIPNVNVNSSLSFTLYDQDPLLSPEGKPLGQFHKVNRFLVSAGKGMLRLTRFNINFGTRFGGGQLPSAPLSQDKPLDSLSLGERFSLRRNMEEPESDLWGDESPGYQPFSATWNLAFDVNYSYNHELLNLKSQSLNLSFDASFKITPTWNITLSTQYDAIKNEIISPIVRINKDLHCWDLTFIWYPYGSFTGFYFRFGIKSSVLRDLKIERRSVPLY
ncbi:MAG: putative LPS assembly protein LptD [Ignavibacteria bacterium]|nr:putative LPS assembly protein LptD [Ignavibacteria bacterium]